MSSAKFGEKQSSPLAVLTTSVEHEQVDCVSTFCEQVSEHERRLIQQWNATEQTWSDDCCLHELLEVQADRTPDAPAVICGDVVLSYRELNEQAHRVAARLLEAGIQPQEPVGVVADCSHASIVGILGILKAGGAYLPLDKTLPEDRLRYFLEDAAVRLVVGQGSESWLQGKSLQLIAWQDLPAAEDVQLPKVSPDSLAYVLYTSGSTGKAKGVMLNHRGPVNTIRDINERFNIQSVDRVLALSSLGFDLSVYDLFGMFAVGATIVQPTLAQSRDPAQWCELIQRHSVSVWNTVPALMDMLVTYSSDSMIQPTLRLVMLSGDWIPVSLPDRIRAVAPHAQVISLGGSTEASIWSVLYPIGQVDPQWRSIPYGSAMINQRLYVVDANLRLCPIGEVGELCLAGIGVAQGYLNKTELTAERFVIDPWGDGALMYRTGDLCRYLPDGNLEFLGRRDHQVKIRGYRIGLGEIESEIGRLPEVRDAAVIASDEGAGARLIAYVVLNSDCSLTLDQLNAQLGQVLPEYMLPSALVMLPRLPLSANGKVDRKQLPLPTIQRSTAELQLPTTQTETVVSDILCELLKLPQIDTRDDFYALGGHSLLAVALVCRVRQVCGVQLSVPEVLSKSLNTIELARLIDECSEAPVAIEPMANLAEPCERLTRAPLSYSQQQLWVVNFLEHKRQRYNVPLIYDIQPPTAVDATSTIEGDGLSEPALSFAFSELIRRHDILRTVYAAQHSCLEQIVLTAAELPWSSFDLRDVAVADRHLEFARKALEFVTQPFNLSEDLPIRAALYRLDERQWRLVISIHHIAIDGLSINLIQREIAERYKAFLDGRHDPVAAPTHQFANYAQWQHVHMPPSYFETERAYWREQLSGPLPVLDLPQDRHQDVAQEGETLYFELDRSLYQSVTRFARESQVTPFIALLAAIKAVFYRYTGQTDIVIGSPVSTRANNITQELIGYFINVLPLRTQFDGQGNFADLVGRVRNTVLGALAHGQYPLELLKKELLSSEVAGQDPFRVMFVLEDEPEPLQLKGLECRAQTIDTQTAKFDLLIAAFVGREKIRFELQYRRPCFCRERIAAFADHLQAWLQAAVAHPDQPIDRLAWLPNPIRTTPQGASPGSIVSPANRTTQQGASALRLSVPSFLIGLAEQVARSPEAPAAAFQSTVISYAELDRRASSLAGALQEQGIGIGARVGVNLPRSIEMIVAVWGVLKTGAAYVPIDPAWPGKRREQVMQDCQPAFLLTTASMNELRLNDRSPQAYQPVSIDPESVAYILYTSGSTGRPKGVAMRHAALDNLIAWQIKTSVADQGTKTLQFASLGFDVSFQEIFASLCSGGLLALVSEELQQDLNQLWKFIVSERIERLFLPFVALRGLTEIAGNQANRANLKEVITAGEQLQITPAVRSFFQQLPECRLWNHYGPTETHVVTAKLLEGDPQNWPGTPSIGQPIANCEVVVLDRQMQPVPQGIMGELYLGGQCLAQGYYANPQLTSERFINYSVARALMPAQDSREGGQECAPGEGERMYRTGDLGLVGWDGEIQFVGRNDHQVKVRGHRVELGEIELALAQCPGISQAIVCVHNCGAGTQLRAYLIATRPDLDVASVASQLADSVPAYMLPNQYIVVDQFPTTATGKVDRERLTKLHSEQIKPIAKASSDKLDDPIIARLKPIWQRVLEVEQLDADVSFFDYGGDSLAAAILFSLMEAEFGRAISIDTLVKSPTLRQLAEVYREQSEVADQTNCWDKLVPLQPHGTQTPVICLAGIDGHFLNFRHMAGLLGDDRPMFGLQPVGIDGIDTPLTAIEEMAAHHVATLKAAMPSGPYNLVGFSFGGIVAYEMAQILRRQGEQVSLALIDCSTGLPQRATLLQSIAFHLRYVRQLPADRRWQYFMERVNGYWLGIKFKLKLINWEERLEGLIDVKGHYSRVAAVNMNALSRYQPQPATGAAVLYRAKLRANWPGTDRIDPAVAWSPLFASGQFEVIDIEGAHASVMNRPNVDSLVEHLRGILF